MEGLQYLNSKLEPRRGQAEKKQAKKEISELEVPFGNVDWEERGSVVLEKSGTSFNLTYGPSKLGAGWRKLESLTLNEIGKKDGKTLDLLSEVEDGVLVSFRVKNIREGGRARSNGSEIQLFEDITTPKGLIILLHEVGHNVYMMHKETKGLTQEGPSYLARMAASSFSNKEKMAENLRDERTADAYIVKKIKPFIGTPGFSKSAILKLIHERHLQLVSFNLRGVAEGAIMARLNDIIFYLKDLIENRDSSDVHQD